MGKLQSRATPTGYVSSAFTIGSVMRAESSKVQSTQVTLSSLKLSTAISTALEDATKIKFLNNLLIVNI